MKKNDPSPSQRSPQSCRTKQFTQILHRLIGNRQRFEGQTFHVTLWSVHIMAIKWFIDLNCFKLLCRTPTRRPRIYSISASNPVQLSLDQNVPPYIFVCIVCSQKPWLFIIAGQFAYQLLLVRFIKWRVPTANTAGFLPVIRVFYFFQPTSQDIVHI